MNTRSLKTATAVKKTPKKDSSTEETIVLSQLVSSFSKAKIGVESIALRGDETSANLAKIALKDLDVVNQYINERIDEYLQKIEKQN